MPAFVQFYQSTISPIFRFGIPIVGIVILGWRCGAPA
jgi:hypothetical protein